MRTSGRFTRQWHGKRSRLGLFAGALGLLLGLGCSSSGKSKLNVRSMADALAAELSQELELDNAVLVDGPPPEEHAGDPGYPQLTRARAPLYFSYGNAFEIDLESGFEPAAEVMGAVVHIAQANTEDEAPGYLLVTPPAPALSGGHVVLRGRLAEATVGGNAFTLRIALMRNSSTKLQGVGNYLVIHLIAPPAEGTTPKVPHCLCADGVLDDVEGCAGLSRSSLQEETGCALWSEAFAGDNPNELSGGSLPMPAGTRLNVPGEDCVLELTCPENALEKFRADQDRDGVEDALDSCPLVFNPTLSNREESEPGAAGSCDRVDQDCDGQIDDGVVVPAAAKQAGVCAGAKKVCLGSGGWMEPSYAGIVGYQATEAICDGLDNDCDGLTDESCVEWISIPGGSYQMGAGPTVNVPGFEMTRTEVTVAQYLACRQAGVCNSPGTGLTCDWGVSGMDNHPVSCVSWPQAVSFCAWMGGRLPSEAEWEYAARGMGQSITYPWGAQPPDCTHAVGSGCGSGTMVVCSKTAGNTSQGLCDMAGNVWEWVQDWAHDNYTGAPTDGSAWETPAGWQRLFRGGSWYSDPGCLQVTIAGVAVPEYIYGDLGLRCARWL